MHMLSSLLTLSLFNLFVPLIHAKKPRDYSKIDELYDKHGEDHEVVSVRNLIDFAHPGYSRWGRKYTCSSDSTCEIFGGDCDGTCGVDEKPSICSYNSAQCSSCGKMQVSIETNKRTLPSDGAIEKVQEYWDIVNLLDPTEVMILGGPYKYDKYDRIELSICLDASKSYKFNYTATSRFGEYEDILCVRLSAEGCRKYYLLTHKLFM